MLKARLVRCLALAGAVGLLPLAACGGAGMPLAAARAGATAALPLHTSGRFIVDAAGRRVKLAAVNWYGAEEKDFVPGGLAVTSVETIAGQIAALGFNAVRLPWSNEMVERDPVVPSDAVAANPQLTGRHALEVFDAVVNALAARRLMVILDNHNSDAGWCCSLGDGNALWYNAAYPEASWLRDWQALARRYQAQPYVIGADLRNEPRGPAAWGGPNPAVDWRAAAARGGNAVLAVSPRWLIFVEGVNYSNDLSGVGSQPVRLAVADRVVYSPHTYGFQFSPPVAGAADLATRLQPMWGYLAASQPLWIGEFGTCNTAPSCVAGATTQGMWFSSFIQYLRARDLDWCYWPLNGTESTGAGRTFGAAESYGILTPSWNAVALPALLQSLQTVMAPR